MMIELERVTYSYPGAARATIYDLSLTVGEGEFLLVCGPSGAGKSTLLRLMNGLVPHFHGGSIAGEVRAWGRSTRTHEPRDLADVVGFVFQDPEAQLVVDVVEDEIVFAMENLGLPQKLMRRRVEEVIDQLGIAHLRRRQVGSLSGGERQRVAIASALAAQPRAIVLDEPTSQLDPHAAEEVLTALQKLNADLGLTIVLSEHRLERVVQYADRMLYLPRDWRLEIRDLERVSANLLSPVSYLQSPIIGHPREVLAQVDLAPPLVALAKARGWSPLPLTIKEARGHVRAERASERRGEGVNSSAVASSLARPVAPSPPRPVAGTPSLVVEHVHFSYGEHEALYDLSLSARPGEVLALMGRNGSGKTTLLKLLVGLLKAQHGKVTALGQDVARRDVEDMAAFVGYVPQDPRSLLFHDTVREELEFTLRGRGEKGSRRGVDKATQQSPFRPFAPSPARPIDATLGMLGIAHLAGAYPRDLSGGEAQRAAMAAIMVAGPPALLLDEPTRGLDYAAKAGLGRLLRRLAAEGRTIVMSTHDVELVAAYADRVALLSDGELVVEGPVREVLSDSLIFSSQVAKLFPGTGWLTVEDTLR
jgi:energy-coupling factor transport system ATP-binding protein